MSKGLHEAKSGRRYKNNDRVKKEGTRTEAAMKLVLFLLAAGIVCTGAIHIDNRNEIKEAEESNYTEVVEVITFDMVRDKYLSDYRDDDKIIDYINGLEDCDQIDVIHFERSSQEDIDGILNYVRNNKMDDVKRYAEKTDINDVFWITMLSMFYDKDGKNLSNSAVLNEQWVKYGTNASVYDFSSNEIVKLIPGSINDLWKLFMQCLKDNAFDLDKSLKSFFKKSDMVDEFYYRYLRYQGKECSKVDFPKYIGADSADANKRIAYYIANDNDIDLKHGVSGDYFYHIVFSSYDRDSTLASYSGYSK